MRSALAIHQWQEYRKNNYPQLDDKDWLVENYHKQEKTQTDISKELGCSRMAVKKALERLGIPKRGREDVYAQAAEKRKGENSWNWKGGVYNGRVVGWAGAGYQRMKFQKTMREKYGTTCQKCGREEQEAGRLEAHHIIPWRFGKDSSGENGVLLCPKCHGEEDRIFLEKAGELYVSQGCPGLAEHVSTWRSKTPTTISQKDS